MDNSERKCDECRMATFYKGIPMSTSLTPREKIILDLLIERGLTNKQLARQLHCAESTIKLHIGNLLDKYGARNRLQLVLFAQKQIH